MLYVHVVFRVDEEMGIRGLTSFVDDHPELLTGFHLHDTRIVIDGNNLYHFLYYYFHVPCEYAGDYDQFAQCCDAFFAALHSCSVTPYVVFDGAHAADGNKFKTSLARACERVHMSNIVAHGRRAKILPVLAHSCFVHVLQRLGVQYVTCDFEADHQIAALARHWNCPVLTNDSDFFIYDIPAGVILLDYLNLRCKVLRERPKHSSEVVYRYLEVQIFYCQKFMKFLCVDSHSLLILFATLLGNDIVDGRNFDNFFLHIKLPKIHNNRSQSSHRNRKIAGLTAWLRTVSSASDAIAYIVSKVPENGRRSVGSLIELSLDCYCEPQTDLHEYFDVDNEQRKYTVRTLGKCVLPNWFHVSVRRGAIPTAILNVLASRRLLLLSQIEASCEVSSYRCSQRLRQIAYGIVLSASNSVAECSSFAACVKEFDRDCKTLKMCSVEPASQLNGKPLPCLSEVSHIDRRERFRLLLESLDMSVDGVFDIMIPDTQFLIAVMRYWILHATEKLSCLHIHALLLCCVKLGALDSYFLIAPQSAAVLDAVCRATWLLETKKSQLSTFADMTAADDNESSVFATMLKALARGLDISTDRPSDFTAVEDIRKAEVDKVKDKLGRFDAAPRHNHALTYSAATVYAFAEFQTCFLSAACIASVLGLTVHDPASVLSGTVVYNIMRELRTRTNPDMYITELLGGSSSVLTSCYFQLVNAVLSEVPEGTLEAIDCRPKKKGKRGKKTSCRAVSDGSESSDAPVVDGNEENYVVNCDIDNRFSGLSFTED